MNRKEESNAPSRASESDSLSVVFESAQRWPQPLRHFIETNLTSAEIRSVWSQLKSSCALGRQVLWTGMTREAAQKWADCHGMQTLTTAMGEYMNPKSELCPQREKTQAAWINFIHGASALFALRISQGEVVTVLSNPPPQRFHPEGNTSFQCIEGPIVTGVLGNRAVTRIEIVHPKVSDLTYEVWPEDHVHDWLDRHSAPPSVVHWRPVKQRTTLQLREATAVNETMFYDALALPHRAAPGRLESSKAAERKPLLIGELCQPHAADTKRSQHKKEAAALEAALCKKMREFSSVRKADRLRLHNEHVSVMQGLRGKAVKKLAHQRHNKMRQELTSMHKNKLDRLEKDMRASRQVLRERHKMEMRHSRGYQQHIQVESARESNALATEAKEMNSSVGLLSRFSQFLRFLLHAAGQLWLTWTTREDLLPR